MKQSQFDAKTFGLGELITQRKLFRVPRHQRSYSWTRESVETFLEDIATAFQSKSQEYFVGLLVLQGPEEGEWILLDGQQRLTTVTMIFAAIRNWLAINGFDQDAQQIENEFLSVRRLGGAFSSRMQLNDENQQTYNDLVIQRTDLAHIKANAAQFPKRSSNRQLLEAAIACQEWVNEIGEAHVEGKGQRNPSQLFLLAAFLESHVKAVSVEVSSDVDAYILFESLNDRGVELSALDLLKNYLYSKVSSASRREFELSWAKLNELLEDSNPDDFLKVFWTAKHGTVQKTQLFRRLREKYNNSPLAESLVRELESSAELLSAVDDARHPFWDRFPPSARSRVSAINTLGSKQARPVILSAIQSLPKEEVAAILWHLIVVIVRFQIVSRGRTGIMERVFGRICERLSSGGFSVVDDLLPEFAPLSIPDSEFVHEFSTNVETKAVRNLYFLFEIEKAIRSDMGLPQIEYPERYVLDRIRPLQRSERTRLEIHEIGNFILLERESNLLGVREQERFAKSEIVTTRAAEPILAGGLQLEDIHARSVQLAEYASKIWTHERVPKEG